MCSTHTDKKENKIFLIYNEIQKGAASTYMTKNLRIYPYTVKKIYRIPVFFYQTFQKRENPYADKGFFGALQRRNFLSFEGKVFLSLQG